MERPGGVARDATRQGQSGLGRPPSATSRRDRARPRSESAAKVPRRAGRRGAGWWLQQAGARWDRGQSAPSAQCAGSGLGRTPRAGVFSRSPPQEAVPRRLQLFPTRAIPAPAPSRSSCPPRPSKKLGRRPPTAARAGAWRARVRSGPPPPGPDSGRRSALTSRGSRWEKEASSPRLQPECAGR